MRMEFRTHAYQEQDGACAVCRGGPHEQRRLLSCGGRWDKLRHSYVSGSQPVLRERDFDDAPELCAAHVVIVNDSQIESIVAFAEWVHCFVHGLPRPTALDVLAGRRRGGKTWIMIACVVAAALAAPSGRKAGKEQRYVGWLVVPTYPEQREIHEDVLEVLTRPEGADGPDPRTWFRYRPNPNNVYQFASGAELYIKSANNSDSLKQGRVDVIGINESQKVDGDSCIHAAGNNIDRGGLTILAANPPRKARGAWMLDIKSAWEEGRAIDPEDGLPVIRWFWVDPQKNPHVNQGGRRKYKLVAGFINPKLAAADADNEWNQLNDLVLPKWRHELILSDVPVGWENVTGEVILAMRLREYLRSPSGYSSWGGIDFNKYPWQSAVGLKAYRDPTRGGELIFVIERELCSDPQGDKGRTEKEFIIDLHRHGWDPEELCFIGDPSGQWQSSEHRRRGGVKQGHSSFDLFRSPTEYEEGGQTVVVPGWDIFAPTTWKAKDSKHYAHPRIVESVDDMNELMRLGRLYVLASCAHTIEAFKKCPRGKNGGPDKESDYNHIVDAARYAIHRALNAMEPKTKQGRSSGPVRGRRPLTTSSFGGRRSGGGGMFGG